MIFSKLALVLIGVASIILFTQIRLEWTLSSLLIPITGQSLAVLLVGALLGQRLGTISVLLYILLGVAGLPVFSNGAHGLGVLTGPSGGYLLGFVGGAWLCGYLGERSRSRPFGKGVLMMTFGTAAILLFGGLYLAWLYGWPTAWKAGVVPFMPGAIVKIVLGAAVLWFWYEWKERSRLKAK